MIKIEFNSIIIWQYFSKKTVQLIDAKKGDISCDLMASWTVQVGDMDQCLHLWRYKGGFETIDKARTELYLDEVIIFRKKYALYTGGLWSQRLLY